MINVNKLSSPDKNLVICLILENTVNTRNANANWELSDMGQSSTRNGVSVQLLWYGWILNSLAVLVEPEWANLVLMGQVDDTAGYLAFTNKNASILLNERKFDQT